ncbi:MAG: hypothetical protein Hyperionvirus17_14 [Hyperionvirus sp.]|uniref:Uncharacterized protein n=1 Tax=Hyperionvirus sp. TaxID=2487770 RepID=A0A3G5ABY4_9VIRU|nr:MAG: hypothetical protein Hyperionvirus17_14 [Hyperionvirus sp.]
MSSNTLNTDLKQINDTLDEIINLATESAKNPIQIKLDQYQEWMKKIDLFKTEVEHLKDSFSLRTTLPEYREGSDVGPIDVRMDRSIFPAFAVKFNKTMNPQYTISDNYPAATAAFDAYMNSFDEPKIKTEIDQTDNLTLEIDNQIYKLNKFIYEIQPPGKFKRFDDERLRTIIAGKKEIDECRRLLAVEKLDKLLGMDAMYQRIISGLGEYGITMISGLETLGPDIDAKINEIKKENDKLIKQNAGTKPQIDSEIEAIARYIFSTSKIGDIGPLADDKRMVFMNKISSLSHNQLPVYKNRESLDGDRESFNKYMKKNIMSIKIDNMHKLIEAVNAIDPGRPNDIAVVREINDHIGKLIRYIDVQRKNASRREKNLVKIGKNNGMEQKLNALKSELTQFETILNSEDSGKWDPVIKRLVDKGVFEKGYTRDAIEEYINKLNHTLAATRKSLRDQFALVPKPKLTYPAVRYRENLIQLMLDQKISFNKFHKNSLEFFERIFNSAAPLNDTGAIESFAKKIDDRSLRDKWYLTWEPKVASGGRLMEPDLMSHTVSTITVKSGELIKKLYNYSLLIDSLKFKYNTLFKRLELFYTQSRNVIMYLLYENTVVTEFEPTTTKTFRGYLTLEEIEQYNTQFNNIKAKIATDETIAKRYEYYSVFIDKASRVLSNIITEFIARDPTQTVLDVYNSDINTLLLLIMCQHFFSIVFPI